MCVILCVVTRLMAVFVGNVQAEISDKQFNSNITQNNLGEALIIFLRQVKIQLLFPYNLASRTGIHPVVGQ